MRMVVAVVVVMVIVLLSVVGIYAATTSVFEAGGDDIEDEGSTLGSCLGQAVLEPEEECSFGGDGDAGS